jgi:hypothetical protein
MDQNNVSLPEPGRLERALCSILVTKVIIDGEHTFSEEEIEIAAYLITFQWNLNVTDFLYVIAGIQQPRAHVPEAYTALVFPIKQHS